MNNKLSREMCIFRHISKSRNRKALKFAELTIRSTKQHTQKIVLLSCKGAGGLLKIEKIAQSQKLSRLVGSRGNLSGVISRKVTQVSRDPIF